MPDKPKRETTEDAYKRRVRKAGEANPPPEPDVGVPNSPDPGAVQGVYESRMQREYDPAYLPEEDSPPGGKKKKKS